MPVDGTAPQSVGVQDCYGLDSCKCAVVLSGSQTSRRDAARVSCLVGWHMSAERPIAAIARTAAAVQEQAVRAQDFDAAVTCRSARSQLLALDSEWARLEVLKKDAIFTQEFAGAAEIKASMENIVAQAEEVAKKLPSSILLGEVVKQLPEPLPLDHATADPAVKGSSDSPLLVLIDKHEAIMANAVGRQNFELAGKCKSLLLELTRLQAEWAPLDLLKKDAVLTEDFAGADQLRHSMEELASQANLAVESIQQHAVRAPTKAGNAPTKAGLAARNGREKKLASDQLSVANRSLGSRTQAERLASLTTPTPPRLSMGSSKSIGSIHPLDRPIEATLTPSVGARPKPAVPRPLPKSGARKVKREAPSPMERVQRQMEQRARAATHCTAVFRGMASRAQQRRRHAAATVTQMAWRRRSTSILIKLRVLKRQEMECEAADTLQAVLQHRREARMPHIYDRERQRSHLHPKGGNVLYISLPIYPSVLGEASRDAQGAHACPRRARSAADTVRAAPPRRRGGACPARARRTAAQGEREAAGGGATEAGAQLVGMPARGRPAAAAREAAGGAGRGGEAAARARAAQATRGGGGQAA